MINCMYRFCEFVPGFLIHWDVAVLFNHNMEPIVCQIKQRYTPISGTRGAVLLTDGEEYISWRS